MSKGIGFPSLLTLVFIVLKLSSVISWGWFWVLSPTIFSVLIVIILSVVLAALEVAAEAPVKPRKK